MLTSQDIENIVREFFYQETEGEYWDFKEKPYFYEGQSEKDKNKKKGDLLHDIICMANNMSKPWQDPSRRPTRARKSLIENKK